jgi:hypothetical protein
MRPMTEPAPARRDVTTPAPEPYQPAYLAAGIASLAVFALYAVTLAPTTHFWDASEYITTAHILGIPHPPGNPLFVIMARAWELILAPTGLSVAVRVNLFSAVVSALAHGCWFLLVHRIAASFSGSRRYRLIAAALAVSFSAAAFTVWNHSNVNEKVYTLTLLTIALLGWLAFHWRDNLGRGKDDNLILLMIFILALSVGNHLMAFLAAPALLILVLMVEPRTLLNWRLYGLGVPVAILGLSVHLFLPIRAEQNPIINEADPSCPTVGSAIVSVVTYGRAGCRDLSDALARRQYDKPSMFADPTDPRFPRSPALLAAQIGNYLQYFNWQWARSIGGADPLSGGAGRIAVTLLVVLLGLYGGLSNWRRDRVSAVFIGVLFLTLSAGLVLYLNFKYGYSYMTEQVPNREHHEVRERDYFFIVSFSIWGLWAGLGLAALWRDTATWLAGRRGEALSRRSLSLASPVLALVLVPLLLNWGWASRAGDYTARDWAFNLLMSVEPYGVLFTNGDNDTFPLWYLQEVEGIRRDVTVIVMSYLNTPWYVRQLKQLTTPCPPGRSAGDDRTVIICQRDYESPVDPPLYTVEFGLGEAAPPLPGFDLPGRRPPARSIFASLNDEQIGQIAATPPHLTQEAMTFRTGSIETTLPRGSLMLPSTWFMTSIINDAIADRPIYYATTTQAYEDLRLRPYLIRQGLAFRLNDGPIEEDLERGIVRVPANQLTSITGEFLDLPRTQALLWDVFVHRGGFPDEWTKWVDRPTQQIPLYYWHVHYATGLVLYQVGRDAEAARHEERLQAWADLWQR